MFCHLSFHDHGEFCRAGVDPATTAQSPSARRSGRRISQNDESPLPKEGAFALESAPSGFRTPDPLIKSQLLYQLS